MSVEADEKREQVRVAVVLLDTISKGQKKKKAGEESRRRKRVMEADVL